MLYRTTPRAEATILKRGRELYAFWLRADAAMAALTPPQPPITRENTAASASSLSTSFWRLATVASGAAAASARAAAAVSSERMQNRTGPNPIRSAAASIPHTAANLHGQIGAIKQPLDGAAIVAATGGGIQIHDVQRLKSFRLPIQRNGDRIGQADAFGGVFAAHQLHAGTVAKIEGRNGDHACTSRSQA